MGLGLWDWTVIVLCLAAPVAAALRRWRSTESGLEEYFAGSRSLPWGMAGLSIATVCFASDTPLSVTELVSQHGIAGNWIWWCQGFSALLTVFVFARLWRRINVLTDVEFTELRYSGRPAAFLRGFRAVYLALPVNLIIMGWVNLAMAMILNTALGWSRPFGMWACFALTALYTALSGFRGVAVSGVLQLGIAMTGSLVLAGVSVHYAGGLGNLMEAASMASPLGTGVLHQVPSSDSAWMPWLTFLVYLSLAWWASWYPGGEPGGGGYVTQRIFACKDEEHAVRSTLLFAAWNFVLNSWPWILVALASVALFPMLERPADGYVMVMTTCLSSPWKGLVLGSLIAAYMSTISAHLNWGSSYLINDLYRRFLAKGKSERHYVRAARFATLGLAALSLVATLWIDSISQTWMFLISIGAGVGSVYILRWFWWRINAYSEISAMVAACVFSLILQSPWVGLSAKVPLDYGLLLILTTAGTTMVWLAITFLTKPEPPRVLEKFYSLARPAALGWGPVAAKAPAAVEPLPLGRCLRDWAMSCAFLYSSLFMLGHILLGNPWPAASLALVACGSGYGLYRSLKR